MVADIFPLIALLPSLYLQSPMGWSRTASHTLTLYQLSADFPKYACLEDWLEKVVSERHQVHPRGWRLR